MSSHFFPYARISEAIEDLGLFEAEDEMPDEEGVEPCCYNSSRNFGTGEHEWGCPNY